VRRCVLTVTFHINNDDDDEVKKKKNECNSEYLVSFLIKVNLLLNEFSFVYVGKGKVIISFLFVLSSTCDIYRLLNKHLFQH